MFGTIPSVPAQLLGTRAAVPLSPYFTADRTTGDAGLVTTLRFEARGATYPLTVTFGDGSSQLFTSGPIAAAHTYTSPGDYTASLRSGGVSGTVLQNLVVHATDPNGTYTFDFEGMFPSVWSMLPDGASTTQTIPDTLDLADVAAGLILGVKNSSDPAARSCPQAAALSDNFSYETTVFEGVTYQLPGPKFALPGYGSPNWGEVMLAVACAREMTGFDRNDAFGTVTWQRTSFQNMLSRPANDAVGTNIVYPLPAINPSTYALLAIIHHYRQRPSVALRTAIDTFYRMHRNTISKNQPAGSPQVFAFISQDENAYNSTPVGDLGFYNMPFTQGMALQAFAEMHIALGDAAEALALAQQMREYLLKYKDSLLFRSPNLAKYDFASGKGFNGQTYVNQEAVRGILLYAKAIRTEDPDLFDELLAFGLAIYSFIKRVSRAGWVGSFGSSGTCGDMALIGLLLCELGAGDFYDEIDGWMRNQLTESQIDDAASAMIGDVSDARWQYDHVGSKVKGLFFGDGSHLFSIPTGSQAFTTDDYAMSFLGVHAIWQHIVDVSGRDVFVNFHMNRAHQYLDVKSDVPYRGRVEVALRADIGPLTTLYIHVPTYLPPGASVQVTRRRAGATTTVPLVFGGPYGNYATVTGLAAGDSYVLTYPMVVQTIPVTQRRSDNQIWYEGLYTTLAGFETPSVVDATFRGTTLVHTDAHRADPPAIPRYVEAWRAHLYGLGSAEEAPPTKTVSRFVYMPPAQIPVARLGASTPIPPRAFMVGGRPLSVNGQIMTRTA